MVLHNKVFKMIPILEYHVFHGRLQVMQSYFQLDAGIIHLNHAAVAPWPVVTRDAVISFAKENAAIGSQNYALWMETEQQLKQKMALLINADSTAEIAILKNTSEGLSVIAQGLDFAPGDNIVVPAEEFPSNKIVWQVLAEQGVELRLVPLQDAAQPEQALINAMDSATRLLSCSSVQYARGLRLELQTIGLACRQNNTLFCVDAIQSLGAIAFDVNTCFADFVVADGHKWLCGPEGSALFYCRKERQALLTLRQHGWHMRENMFDFSYSIDDKPLAEQFANNARRFESGSPNMTGIMAMNASLGLLLDIGISTIQQAVLENTTYLIKQLQARSDISILSPVENGRYAGIVTFIKHDCEHEKLYQQLQNNNIICALRGGGIRFSPHFYTKHSDIDNALNIVHNFVT